MESQQQPLSSQSRPWFRLTSIRSAAPAVAASPPPQSAPSPAPAPAAPAPPPPSAPALPTPPAGPGERPLLRIGSLLGRAPADVQPAAQEPTPPPTAPAPPPPAAPLSSTVTKDVAELPTEATAPVVRPSSPSAPVVRAPSPPSPVVQAPSPRVPTAQATTAWVTSPPALPREAATVPQPQTAAAVSPASSPSTTIYPPSPTKTARRSPPPAPSPRRLSPEPETKPMVSVVAPQANLVQEPVSHGINGTGGKPGISQAKPPEGTPPPVSLSSLPKKPDPTAAAAPAKKKSGGSQEEETTRLRMLTLAGENTGAYMNLGGAGGRRVDGTKGQGPRLAQTPPTKGVGKFTHPGAPGGSNGGTSPAEAASPDADNRRAASAKPVAALVNSNVQSVNNSVLFNSACVQQSPGVHITIARAGGRLSSRKYGRNGGGGGTASTTSVESQRGGDH